MRYTVRNCHGTVRIRSHTVRIRRATVRSGPCREFGIVSIHNLRLRIDEQIVNLLSKQISIKSATSRPTVTGEKEAPRRARGIGRADRDGSGRQEEVWPGSSAALRLRIRRPSALPMTRTSMTPPNGARSSRHSSRSRSGSGRRSPTRSSTSSTTTSRRSSSITTLRSRWASGRSTPSPTRAAARGTCRPSRATRNSPSTSRPAW